MKSIQISSTVNKPIYQQLFDQISTQILNGDIPTDYLLPSIRTAAKELRISIITVKKAWDELEQKGFIYTVPGKGCFVSKLSKGEISKKRDEQVLEKLKKDIEYYKSIDLSEEELIDFIRKHYH